jgi:hypothetical protein
MPGGVGGGCIGPVPVPVVVGAGGAPESSPPPPSGPPEPGAPGNRTLSVPPQAAAESTIEIETRQTDIRMKHLRIAIDADRKSEEDQRRSSRETHEFRLEYAGLP